MRKPVQDQEREANGHFSLDDTVHLVDTKREARTARKHLGIKAIEFDWFLEVVENCDRIPLLVVVSACDAYWLAKIVTERYGPGINVRFVDLEGLSLEIMAKQQSSRLNLLIRNPWHMTMTSGSC